MTLVSILPSCSDTDSLALLTLFHLLSKDFPQLLEPSIPQLCECLTQPALTTATIQVLKQLGTAKSQSLYDHIPLFKSTAETFPSTTLDIIQLLTVVCLSSVEKSRQHISYLLEKINFVEPDKQTVVLKELYSITSRYPSLLNTNLINQLTGLEDEADDSAKAMIDEIKNEYHIRRLDRSLEKLSIKDKINPKHGATLISIKGIPDSRNRDSKPIDRFSTHRSMTRLNIHNAGRLDNRLTHKSMTRLDHRYFSNQLVPAQNKHLSLVQAGSPPPIISPVKSMSSGSVTGLDYNRPSGIEPTGASWARGVEVGGWGQRVDRAGGRSTRGGGVEVTGGGWSARVAPEGTGVSAPTSAWDRDNREVGDYMKGGGSRDKDVFMQPRVGSRDQLEQRHPDPRLNSRDPIDPRFNSRDKLTLSINKITTDIARQSSRLSTVLTHDYAKSPTALEYAKSPEYEKPPPEYSRISAEYKMPPDYKSITGDYSRQTGSGRDLHHNQQPHSINSYQNMSLAGQKRITAHSSGPIYSPTRMYSSGQLMAAGTASSSAAAGQQPHSFTGGSQLPPGAAVHVASSQQPPAYSDSLVQQQLQRPLSGSIPLGPGQTYPFPGSLPSSHTQPSSGLPHQGPGAGGSTHYVQAGSTAYGTASTPYAASSTPNGPPVQSGGYSHQYYPPYTSGQQGGGHHSSTAVSHQQSSQAQLNSLNSHPP